MAVAISPYSFLAQQTKIFGGIQVFQEDKMNMKIKQKHEMGMQIPVFEGLTAVVRWLQQAPINKNTLYNLRFGLSLPKKLNTPTTHRESHILQNG